MTLSSILVGALLLWWRITRTQAAPVVSHCRCGDIVQHVRWLPARCPSCGAVLW